MIAARSKPGGSDNDADGVCLVNQKPGCWTRVAKVTMMAMVAGLLASPVSAQQLLPPVPVTEMPVVAAAGQPPVEPKSGKEGASGAGTIIPAELRPRYRDELGIIEPPLSEIGEPGNTVLRVGGWYVENRGSPLKTGEYQGLSSNPFFEFDGLYSNGVRTLGIYANHTDSESNQAALHYFGPNLFVDLDFQRFIHRLDHRSLDNFLESNPVTDKLGTPATTGYPGSKSLGSKTTNNAYALGKDLNVGEDYAIRVEEARASFGDRINDNLRFRVDVWEMRKFGERQANAMAHCFQASAGGARGCHTLSQSQHIDWLTVEVTPRLEAHVGPVTVEYSRPMRQFTQSDQLVYRDYQGRGGQLVGTYPYAIVPENTTQIDQLKGAIDLGPTRQVYAFGYLGNTDNYNRDFSRYFNGYDLRYTDWTIPRTSLTAYARRYEQTGNLPTSLLPDETGIGPKGESQPLPKTTPVTAPEQYIAFPLEYHRNTGGVKGNWRPDLGGGLLSDLIFTAGYEYDHLERVNATWQTPPRGPAAGQLQNNGTTAYTQGNTTTQTPFVGVSKPWDWNIDTFVRYKVLFVDDPLYGIRQLNGVLNTNQPQQQHIVEFGGGWYPLNNFAITVQQDIEVGQSANDNNAVATGNLVDFAEQSYATTVTMWYAPTPQLSMAVGVSRFSNWINQNMFLGDNYFDGDSPPDPKTANLPLATQPTTYAGTANLFDFHLYYLLTEQTRLNFGYQFVRGNNRFNMQAGPSFAFPVSSSTTEPLGAISFADLPRYSAVLVETNKITAGVSWRPMPLTTVYLNYNFFDYNDETTTANSGTAHMVFAGLSRIW